MVKGKWIGGVCIALVLGGVTGIIVSAAEVKGVSVSPQALTIDQASSGSFELEVTQVDGNVSGRAAQPPDLTYCAAWTIHADGTIQCTQSAAITLAARNYTQSPVTAGEYRRTVTVNVDAGVPCGGTYEIDETVTANNGSGVEFGSGVMSVTRTVTVTVTCPLVSVGGCSHGYWKNHTSSWPTGFTTNTMIGEVFSIGTSYTGIADKTLAQGLDFGGGRTLSDKARLLFKQAVAALLNAAHPEVNYEIVTAQEIIDLVNDALATNDAAAILALEARLEALNHGSLFCGDIDGGQ